MDTLCVTHNLEDIHRKAIMKMRDIYAEVERVLVLDVELMASTAQASYEEINMRIKCSRWIRRLWTLQEAVLAKRPVIQLAERAHLIGVGTTLWYAQRDDLKVNYFDWIGRNYTITLKTTTTCKTSTGP
jgi:hypothetical protein